MGRDYTIFFEKRIVELEQERDQLKAALAREREVALEECRKQAVRILNEPFHPIGLSGLELFIAWIEEAKKAVGVNQAAG